MSNQVEEAGSVKFLQFHRPALADGDYEITVTQSVQIPDNAIPPFIAKQSFTVAGNRFELKPTDVQSVFPPDGNLGEHSNVLPHLILNRSTLPWERRVAPGEEEKLKEIPWLMLLIFNEEEKPKPDTKTLRELQEMKVDGPQKFPPLILEKGQHLKDMVTIIDVPWGRLQEIMATAEELKLLAHVRTNGQEKPNADGEESNGKELAVIISNRLPEPARTSVAHLVSVEGRFKKGTSDGEYHFDFMGAKDKDVIRLVSLNSWRFTCADKKKGFKELLVGLNKNAGARATLRLPGDAGGSFASRGYVLLPHYFRHGDLTASWFHGPLIPGENRTPGDDTPPAIKLPARSAEQLVHYDSDISMFDVSYAAAWELGRLLALQDKAFSVSLYQWKRRHAQRRAQEKQLLRRLPFQKQTPTDLPDDLSLWFKNLRKLKGVPFNYLVPDERMLPAESIRFFRVDQAWLDCLADGAFSIGRVTTSDHNADKLLGQKSPAAGIDTTVVTGFLLRSELVSGWPGLLIDAYDKQNPRPLDDIRIERLAAGVLLCMFPGEIARVEIHQQPESLHFGLDKDGDTFSKKLREPDSGKSRTGKVVLEPNYWRSVSQRIINVTVLAQALKKELTLSSLTSAQFALQMVEGVDKVIFSSSTREHNSTRRRKRR
jgi:hypothetical protein